VDGQKLLVAIVDDEQAIRKALRRLLLAADINAETFDSGQAFLNSLVTKRPDCVVLDLHMPGLTGLEVLEQLAASRMQLPTVIITAYDEPASRAQCLAAGAVAFLRKPLDDHALLETIATAVGRAPGSFGASTPLDEK
jgi:FixJ family two-component response regulator